ncbi:MAG TPA: methyltransferase domain-containing protein [Rhodospirillales bacterium]|nr:methyltransferase domain-containing protein [Rhodospirillales bacterium]
MSKCIVCGGSRVEAFLDLGNTSLANKFIAGEDLGKPEPYYDLNVGFCPGCHHVQLTETVPPTAMFDDYLYISSLSDTLVDHLRGLAATVTERMGLKGDDLAIDIGCNDGTLLTGFRDKGVKTLGVDPAQNLAALAAEKGIATHVGYFGEETAKILRAAHGPAEAITATNVFPHIPDLADFVKGLDIMLEDGGVFVLEAHYLQDLLDHGAYDTVYHEHCSYWALGPMQRLFAAHGMEIFDVERLPIHHGQLRAWVQRKGARPLSERVADLSEAERANGLDKLETFVAFAEHVRKSREELNAAIDKFRADGKTIVGYGAPAKGNTLLTFLGVGPDKIAYIADKSPLKQGRYTPGTHIPVVDPARLLEEQPDYVLLLAWNFAEEIMAQQNEYRVRGGKFIIPVPNVKIV